MKRLVTVCVATLLTSTAAGQILECVDAKGRKEFAQSCPPGTVKETKLLSSGAGAASSSTAPAGKTLTERDAEFRKRALERQESEAKAEKEKADSRVAERNCTDARIQLKQLQDGGRIGVTDPNTGERGFLEDKDRPGETGRAQKAVDVWCKR